MISSFTVGSVFKLVDEFSPALRAILKQIRELNVQLDQARTSLASLGKVPAGLTTAVTETAALATAWGNVAKNAGAAQRAIGAASTTAVRSAPAAAAAATGGGRHRPGWLGGGGGAHISGPGMPVPGVGHVRYRGPGMVAAGALGWGIDQAAQTEKYAYNLAYHSHQDVKNPAVLARFRKILQDAQIDTGFSIKDVGEAALDAVRQFQGVEGGGIDALPEILRTGATEAQRLGPKGGRVVRGRPRAHDATI
jgi:hypothetical protein